MKILVTGGAGFIGSNFIIHMLEKYKNYKIICMDKLTYAANLDNLIKVKDNLNYKFIQADISDRETVYKVFEEEKLDMVVNFAAETHVDRSIEKPDVFIQTNVVGVGVLLDACVKYGIKRFHQISTDEVYGDIPIEDNMTKLNETSKLNPSSPYSASKAAADLLVMSYHRTYKLPVTISRCSNNYGPHQHKEKLIPMVIYRISRDEPIPIYGDGRNIREWIYVIEHCEGIDIVLHKGVNGEIYNIGTPYSMSNIELVKKILDVYGKNYEMIEYVSDRKGHDLRYAMDSSKMYKEFGWKANINLDEGIEKMKNLCSK